MVKNIEKLKRQNIDWKKTGRKLLELRFHNLNLRRYVCYATKHEEGKCNGECFDCEYDIDSSISRKELSSVFNCGENVIFNWENGKTPVSFEDLVFYSRLCDVDLFDLIVWES